MKTASSSLIAISLIIILISTVNIAYAKEEQIVNILANPYFAEGIAGWNLECHDPFVKADIMADHKTKVIGEYSLKTEIREIQEGAEIFRCQPKQTGLTLVAGQRYTWSFWARAVDTRVLQCQVLIDTWNWRLIGLDKPVVIDKEWKEYYNSFTCTEDFPNSRITWLCAGSDDDFWLDNVILYEGEYVEGLMADELTGKPHPVNPRSALATTWGKAKRGY